MTGYKEINKIAQKGVKYFIIYSTYLDNEDNYEIIENETTNNIIKTFPDNLVFSLVKKTKDSKSNIHNLINEIFVIAQQQDKG
jgi:predicted acetyltransferase